MDRRNFLKSIGAFSLAPLIPTQPLALNAAIPASTPAAPAFSAHTYQWAEMIVRAHDKCNIGLLQRSLHVDANVAQALKSSLIKNGVVQSQANAYGIHKAAKPLYKDAFLSISETSEKAAKAASDFLEKSDEHKKPVHYDSVDSQKIDSNTMDIEDFSDSETEEQNTKETVSEATEIVIDKSLEI